jgi:hypothetical protein
MKLGNRFFLVFLFAIIFFSGFQFIASFYGQDLAFEDSVKNQLVDSVYTRTEMIDDYFYERISDVKFLSNDFTVVSVFNLSLVENEEAVSDVEDEFGILVSRLNLFIERNLDWDLDLFLNDEQFLSITLKSFGDNSDTYLLNSETGEVLLGEKKSMYVNFEKDFDVRTRDGILLSLGVNIDGGDYFSVSNVSSEVEDYISRYLTINGYDNIYFISNSGQIIYGTNVVGQNIFYDGSYLPPLKIIYNDTFLREDIVSHGPYKKIGEPNYRLLFSAPVYFNEEIVGIVVLEDDFNEISEIVNDEMILAENYIVDADGFLITLIEGKDYDPFVQSIDENVLENCFYDESFFKEFKNYEGKLVYGVYSGVDEVDWCIISEVSKDLLIEIPKSKSFNRDLLFTFCFVFIFLMLGLYFRKKYNVYNVRMVRKINDFYNLKKIYVYLMILIAIFSYFFVEGYAFVLSSFFVFLFLVLLSVLFLDSSRVKNNYLRIMFCWGILLIYFVNLFNLIFDLNLILFGYVKIMVLIFEMLGFSLLFFGIKNFGGKK